MKLRFERNKLRLRLSQNEVQSISEGKSILEEISFGDTRLVYEVGSGAIWSAEFADGKISIAIPNQVTNDWFESDIISLENSFSLENQADLKVLVEKDFKCLNPRKDDKDKFPHPKAGQEFC